MFYKCMPENKWIRVSERTHKFLENKKLIEREPFDDVLQRLLKISRSK